jgi:type II secretory pathway component GspD/PulD (secretin)
VKLGTVKSFGSIDATLEALETQNKANIISNPRITTVNNREASVVVGQQIPLIVQDFAGNAVTQLTTIGIKLSVTPHINVGNKITMDVHPEVSDLAAQATVQGGIIINTTMADTRVMVNDGETAVIGGLIRSNESTTKRGVPVLMDIPLIGNLFRSNSRTKAKRELLIFVTPKILADQSASN